MIVYLSVSLSCICLSEKKMSTFSGALLQHGGWKNFICATIGGRFSHWYEPWDSFSTIGMLSCVVIFTSPWSRVPLKFTFYMVLFSRLLSAVHPMSTIYFLDGRRTACSQHIQFSKSWAVLLMKLGHKWRILRTINVLVLAAHYLKLFGVI